MLYSRGVRNLKLRRCCNFSNLCSGMRHNCTVWSVSYRSSNAQKLRLNSLTLRNVCTGHFTLLLLKKSLVHGQGQQHKQINAIKVRVHPKAVITPLKIGQMEISCSHFKQYKNPPCITQINDLGCFMNF